MNSLSNDPHRFFHMDSRPDYIEDLFKTEIMLEEIYIDGKTKGLGLLYKFTHLKKLWIYDINQKQFEEVINQINLEMLLINGLRVSNLIALNTLSKLEVLCLEWNTKAEKLWDFSFNKNLRELEIVDFSALRDISELPLASELLSLTLSGGDNKPLKIDTLEPLRHLDSLRCLILMNLKDQKDSIRPLASLNKLISLEISNQFPTEDYAYHSVKLPDVKSSNFHAYYLFSEAIGEKNVMINGKGKPFLNSVKDAKKSSYYENQFLKLQEKYKEKEDSSNSFEWEN